MKIPITFPNSGEYLVPIRLISNWNVKEVKKIGNTIFFTVDGLRLSMLEDNFNEYCKY